MASREILLLGDPFLWERCSTVEDYSKQATGPLVRDLADTLQAFREANGFGRGIAAPQIGISKRLIFVRMGDTGFGGPLINPEITWSSPRQLDLWDDCFSIPNLMVRVRRAAQIHVRYYDADGREQRIEADGGLSELLQHEIDHLDGILTVQRAISPTAFATRDEWLKQIGKR